MVTGDLVDGLNGAKAIDFDGSTQYLEAADHEDWNFSTEDFTIEFLSNPDNLSERKCFVSQHADNDNLWQFGHHQDGIFVLVSRVSGTTQIQPTTTPSGLSTGSY